MAAAIETLRSALGGISPRDKRVLLLLAAVLALSAVAVGYYLIASAVDEVETERAAAVEALRTIRNERGRIRARQEQRRAMLARYETRAPALTSYVEAAAREASVTVSEATDRTTPPPEGRRFQRRTVSIRLRNVNLQSLVAFMDRVESAPFPVAITSLRVRRRFGEVNAFDVDDMVISTWDRMERPTPRRGQGGSAGASAANNAQELR